MAELCATSHKPPPSAMTEGYGSRAAVFFLLSSKSSFSPFDIYQSDSLISYVWWMLDS